MSEYIPDRWVMLKISDPNTTCYKILAGWGGSYLHGQSWKLNSGVTKVEKEGDYLLFSGYSGSVYKCHTSEGSYGFMSITSGVYETFMKQTESEEAQTKGIKIELMPENTDFMSIKYED